MTYLPISRAPLLMMDRVSLPGLEPNNPAFLCGGGELHSAKLLSNTCHVFLLRSYDRHVTYYIWFRSSALSLFRGKELRRGSIQYTTWRLGLNQPLWARAPHSTTNRGLSWKQAQDGTTSLRTRHCYLQSMAERMLGCFLRLHLW